MDNITSKGLPQIVQDLLEGQSAKSNIDLEFKITCSGTLTQLTLTWRPSVKNSPPQGCCTHGKIKPTGYKRKTPSDKRRDNLRKQEYMARKRQNIQRKFCSESDSKEGAIVSPADCVSNSKVSDNHRGTVTRSMAKLAKQKNHVMESPEMGRSACTTDGDILSPGNISVDHVDCVKESMPLSPLCNETPDRTLSPAHAIIPGAIDCDHINTPDHGTMHAASLCTNSDNSLDSEPEEVFDIESAIELLSKKLNKLDNSITDIRTTCKTSCSKDSHRSWPNIQTQIWPPNLGWDGLYDAGPISC